MWYHRISFQLPGSHPITITPSCCSSTNTYPTPPARRSWRPRGAAQVRAGGGTSPLSGAPPSPRDPSWTAWCCTSRGHCLTAGSAPGSGCHGRRHAYGLRRRQRRRSQVRLINLLCTWGEEVCLEGCDCIIKMDCRLAGAGIAVLWKMEVDSQGLVWTKNYHYNGRHPYRM